MGSSEPVPTGVPAGTLDLSLPTTAELLAASAPNPYLERDRVKQGNVAEILDLAADFAAAGGDMTLSAQYSLEAQQHLAENFTNDATPVYDQATHLDALPKDFHDAGPRMIQLSRRLDIIAADLDTTQNQADTTWTTMLDSLDAKRAAFATQVQAALDTQGLIPHAAVPGLLATRDTYASFMQVDVNAAGATMDKRRRGYEGTLADGTKLLADFGYIPPDELDAGRSGSRGHLSPRLPQIRT